jgi:hypothetical protein
MPDHPCRAPIDNAAEATVIDEYVAREQIAVNPDGLPGPLLSFQGFAPDKFRPTDVDDPFELTDAPQHSFVVLRHGSTSAGGKRPIDSGNPLQRKDEVGHVFREDIPVGDRGPIQADAVQPGIDEPGERVTMAGPPLGQGSRYRGREVHQLGEPSTFFLYLSLGPMDTRQPYAQFVPQPIDGIVGSRIWNPQQPSVGPLGELILEEEPHRGVVHEDFVFMHWCIRVCSSHGRMGRAG